MQHEIKEVYALAINCIMIAMVLVLVSMGMHVRNSFAASKNNQISKEKEYQQYLTYGSYNDTIVTGDQAISIIREFYATDGITVYMNQDDNGNSLKVDRIKARQNKNLVNIDKLKNRINPLSSYHVWIVYDGIAVEDFVTYSDENKRNYQSSSSVVTGVVLVRE